jgi:Tol biopolymer transport system component
VLALNGKKVERVLSGDNLYEPEWSPRGGEVVFVRNPSPYSEKGLIETVRTDGRGIRSIVRGLHPDISPDGSELSFTRAGGIYVMPLAGGKPTLVIRKGDYPEWSPDGRYLAFMRRVNCSSEGGCAARVFVAPATGGKANAYGPEIFEVGPLSWSR